MLPSKERRFQVSGSARADREQFERQFSYLKSLARANKRELERKPFLTVQLSFWMESVRLLLTGLETWEYTGNHQKYAGTIKRIHKAFYYINRLILYLDEEPPEEVDLGSND